MLSMIWAEDKERGIGLNGKMAWYLPEDLKWFKEATLGKTVVFGRTTWEGFDEKYLPFKGRKNVILTSNADYLLGKDFGDTEVVTDPGEILERAKSEDIFICGGLKVYESFIDYAQKLFVTIIDETFETDTNAPEVDAENYTQKVIKDEVSASGIKWRVVEFTQK